MSDLIQAKQVTGVIKGTVGPTDNVVPRSDGTGGVTLQPSALAIDDTGKASGVTFDDPTSAQQPATKASSEAAATNAASLALLTAEAYTDAKFATAPSTARADKSLAALATVVDGDQACASGVTTTPASSSTAGGYVGVRVNGVSYHVGDGTKVGVDCYFSNDGGATARAMKAIAAGDLLRWNGSVAGFQLETTDKLDFIYDVTT